jgi:predicted RNA-binding Zn-ribbon protein involved in translation (DUF1610 family)
MDECKSCGREIDEEVAKGFWGRCPECNEEDDAIRAELDAEEAGELY